MTLAGCLVTSVERGKNSVWRRVVSDILAFCRALVAALTEKYPSTDGEPGTKWRNTLWRR